MKKHNLQEGIDGLDKSGKISIEFYNRTNYPKKLWIEPNCIEVELDTNTEFKFEAVDNSYRIEFDENVVIFYLQYTFCFKLYKRPISTEIKNPFEWVLAEDHF